MSDRQTRMTSTHWGAYRVSAEADRILEVQPFEDDPMPSPIGYSIPDAVHHRSRVSKPMIRRGWLEGGPGDAGGARGRDPYVPVDWDEALDLVAGELCRVRETYGNAEIFGGSYGWASAGRFHHALSQVHRFLNCLGGYTYSVNSYSTGAAQVIIPRVLGVNFIDMMWHDTPSWPVIAENTKLLVMFGGIGVKNAQVSMGGVTRHSTGKWLERCRDGGVAFVNISPLRNDTLESVNADWLPVAPNSDVALMLGLAYVIETEALADREFLERYCCGYDRFRPYLLGETDGVPKTPEWAEAICGIAADRTRGLARRMAATRCLISVSWSLQRGDHGEQPYWMAAVLAAMLGQIGLAGGGVGFGYGAEAVIGNPVRRVSGLTLPQGPNPVESFIPVARIADMLISPGAPFDYDGRRLTYPDIRLVYWCGGNPFHHHQDINRLVEAWQRPETVIVNEPWWSPIARHADIVFPATTTLERDDIGRASNDSHIFAMQRAVSPVGEARDDYDVFSGLAERLGVAESFTEGRDAAAWLRHLYDVFRQQVAQQAIEMPDFEAFWETGEFVLPVEDDERVIYADFRRDPAAHPLATPSGRIEIFSEEIDGFGYDDCPGHPTWLEPAEWLGNAGAYPIHLVSNQPTTRLHSQLDCGETSVANKVAGREPVMIHPDDAGPRGIADGDIVRLYNDRGACLAGARVTPAVRPGVVVLPTGAWYDPEAPGGLDRHGNPNVLTLDKGTSRLAQGPSAHTTLVEIEKAAGEAPEVKAFDPPEIVAR